MLGLLEDILGLYCDNLTENPLENKGKLVLETKNNVWGRLRRAKGVNKQKTRLGKIDFGADFLRGYMKPGVYKTRNLQFFDGFLAIFQSFQQQN